MPSIQHVITVDGDAIDGAVTLDDVSSGEPLPVAGVASDHVAALMFTSGTAGSPKAAMLTHGNLLANIDQARSVPDRVSAADVVYGVIPAYHIFGLNVVLVYGVGLGIAGSAIGTLLAQLGSALALVWVVVRAARRESASLRPDLPGIRQAGRAGVPLIIRTLMLRASLLVMT